MLTGSSTPLELDQSLGKSGSVVMPFIKPYLNKGHSLFIDSWYTTPLLFQKRHELKTGAGGTVRKTPLGSVKLEKLAKGDIDHNKTLMALKWQDRREVIMLSTLHKPRIVQTKKVIGRRNK
jgi:hypothetical protein